MGGKNRHHEKGEHFTKMLRHTMEAPAWAALSSSAQALYPWLKLEWKGPDNNRNGSLQLSVRQMAGRMGCSINTAAKAFHDLQAKGFIVVTKPAVLGCSGAANGPEFEITEHALPHVKPSIGRKLFQQWQKGHDFAVHKANANNPKGRNGRKKSHLKNEDSNVINLKTVSKKASL